MRGQFLAVTRFAEWHCYARRCQRHRGTAVDWGGAPERTHPESALRAEARTYQHLLVQISVFTFGIAPVTRCSGTSIPDEHSCRQGTGNLSGAPIPFRAALHHPRHTRPTATANGPKADARPGPPALACRLSEVLFVMLREGARTKTPNYGT
jgi:hypothetical protein